MIYALDKNSGEILWERVAYEDELCQPPR